MRSPEEAKSPPWHCLSFLCPWLALPYPACLALPCLALPCLALPCLALPCLALPCLALSCLALPCLALPCLALPCLAFPTLPYLALALARLSACPVLPYVIHTPTANQMFASGGTGMPDYASLIPGASVVYGPLMSPDGTEGKLTSPTLATTMLPWADYVLHLLRMPGRVYAENGDAALSTSNSLGSCFAFQGGEGRLTVRLARPPATPAAGGGSGSDSASAVAAGEEANPSRGFVKVTHVSIEHARTAYAPSAAKSAPRAFRVLGWDSDPSAAGASTSRFAGIGIGGGGSGDNSRGSAATALRPYVLVEGVEYSAGSDAPGVQTFAASDESRLLAPPVGWVTLEVQSNHGGKWTCVYGFRVHGDPVV